MSRQPRPLAGPWHLALTALGLAACVAREPLLIGVEQVEATDGEIQGGGDSDTRTDDGGDVQPGDDDPVSSVVPWGEYAASLGVPPCPASTSPVLVVNGTGEELEGGQGITDPVAAGATLSLVEALWISSNRPGYDIITFDAAVFPLAVPGRIAITNADFSQYSAEAVCLDARGRGVVVEWDSACTSTCAWGLGVDSLVVGLTFVNVPAPLRVSAGGQVAGCHFDTDYVSLEPWTNAVIGPGNVFASGVWALIVHVSGVTIRGNAFGYDPRDGRRGTLSSGMSAFAPMLIEDNIFVTTGDAIQPATGATEPTIVRNNRVGVDGSGAPLGPLAGGLGTYTSGTWIIGPGNIIKNNKRAVGIWKSAGRGQPDVRVTVTRNTITSNAEGIVYVETPLVVAPVVTSASGTAVVGTCQQAGLVEVFSDPADEGETFLGEVSCDGISPWTLHTAPPSGRNVTATLTSATGGTSAFSVPVFVP